MRPDELLTDVERGYGTFKRMDRERIERLKRGAEANRHDVEIASALARLLQEDLLEPDGNFMLDIYDVREALIALRATCARVGLSDAPPPFTSRGPLERLPWTEREELVDSFLSPLIEQLDDREYELFANSLAQAVSPLTSTGWPIVDQRVSHLRAQFKTAREPQHYPAVGLTCISVVEALCEAAFDPSRHSDPALPTPAKDKTKIRLELIARRELGGDDPRAKEIQTLAAAAIELGQAVKHSPASSRRDAGIAADSAILLVNIIRRLVRPPS